jgi:hypothetical protein
MQTERGHKVPLAEEIAGGVPYGSAWNRKSWTFKLRDGWKSLGYYKA